MSVSSVTSEDSDKLCELEAVLRELEELQLQKKKLNKQGQSPGLSHRT